MLNVSCKAVLFVTGFCFISPVIAQQTSTKKDTVVTSLNEVVLTALRTRQENLRVPYTVNAVSGKFLQEFSPRSTPEALIGLPGVFVQKTNHGGGSPFVRGLTGNQTLLLVDGVRMNNSTFRYGPNQYLNTIDMYTIGRIEVAKGTGSVQYGTDAMGGVVQIFTREPEFSMDEKKLTGRLTGKYMTGNMEKTGRGELAYANKKMAFLAGISKKDFGDLIGGDTTGRQSPSGYDEWGMDLNLKISLRKDMTLQVVSQLLLQQQVPVYHKVHLENYQLNEMDPQRRLFSYARLRKVNGRRIFRETELTFSLQDGKEGRNNQRNGSQILRMERDRVRTAGLTIDITSILSGNWTANSGIELYQDKVFSTREDINLSTAVAELKRGLYPDGSVYGNYSVYSLHHFNYGRWLLDAGVRFNQFTARITDTTLGKVQLNPAAFVYNAALLYKLNKTQSVYLSYSSGFRAPNIDDMGTLGIVDFRYEIPATGLQPEKSMQTELGYKIRGRKFSAAAAFFYMDIRNLITRVKDEGQVISGYPVYRKENTDAAFLRGTELSFSAQLTGKLEMKGGLAYTFGQSLTRQEPLRRIPPVNGRALVTYRNSAWFAAAEWQFAAAQKRLAQGDKEDNRIPLGGTPGWNLFNLYGGYKWKQVSFSVGLQNLLNEDYRTHGSGINGVGRSGWLSATLLF